MDNALARKLIRDLFSSTFEKNKFINFTKNLLYSAHFEQHTLAGNDIPDLYKEKIASLEKLASLTDSNGKAIDLLIVTLLKDTSLDKARSMQRNFVAQYLKTQYKDAALVAFVCPEHPYWRFSLIKMDLKFSGINVQESFTPAKRWSFLVGENEGSHTAQSQLVDILANDNNAPTLNDFEKAFSIETATNEFFDKYTNLFNRMRDMLNELVESDKKLKLDFKNKDVNVSDFAKKTMGQIVFLYFLQKKGWFGVAPGERWGTGVKNFLREIFERRKKYGENFFDDVLKPLFYEALAEDRGNESTYTKLNNCRIPFLNGGLFEPMNGYSWRLTNILLPDELFSNNTKTKEGDEGDGIFDIFDRYNFTVNESEPLDQEVAVDPEMLGKVFEKLQSEKEKRKYGSHYTPPLVVYYMCQESLINYLEIAMHGLIRNEDIKIFIHQGRQISQNDKSIFEHDANLEGLMLPKSCIDHAEELDSLLANIKVCDPAVGSGAFPIGMLNEIVSARVLLGMHMRTNPSTYDLKLHAISNSIYGVDLDPGAVEIAKLRFWLSLIVDEDNPMPLPNLEHKIMQGNSLISEYKGIKLFDDDFLINSVSDSEIKKIEEKRKDIQEVMFAMHKSGELDRSKKIEFDKQLLNLSKKFNKLKKEVEEKETDSLDQDGMLFENHSELKLLAKKKARLLQSKQTEYISISNKDVKKNLKLDIDNLRWDLIEATLEERNEVSNIDSIKKLRKDRVNPFFIWKLEFGEVFKTRGGFDVVIGNPPYGTSIKGDDRSGIVKSLGKVPDFEIYYFFIQLSKNLLNDKGVLSYIIPNSYLFNVYAKTFREKLMDEWKIDSIIDFTNYSLFEAVVRNSVCVLKKSGITNAIKYLPTADKNLELADFMAQDLKKLDVSTLREFSQNWAFAFRLPQSTINSLAMIKKNSNHLSQFFPEISQGLIAYDKARGQTEEFIAKRPFHYDDYHLGLKKWLKGGDITKYQVDWNGKKYFDYSEGVANPRDPKYFQGKRMLLREITNPSIFAAIVDSEIYHDPGVLVVKDSAFSLEAVALILNSSIGTFYHFNASSKATKGLFPKILVVDIKEFPITNNLKQVDQNFLNTIYLLAKYSKKYDLYTQVYQNIIDGIVFELYFPDHMKEMQIDIHQFVKKDSEAVIKDADLIEISEDKILKIINQLGSLWSNEDGEVLKRIGNFSERSPDILRPILDS